MFVLVRTSNPGAADVLDLELATGEPLWERLAAMVAELGEGEPLADVGAVTGATAPEHLARMRELMPRTPFLLPGIGAQGGDVAALAPAFAPGRAAGLVTASRSIAGAHEAARRRPRARPPAREAERLREAGLEPRLSERPPGTAWSAAMLARDGRSKPRAVPGPPRAGGLRLRAVSRSSDGGDGRRGGARQHPAAARDRDGDARRPPAKRKRKVYVVKPGDTPSGIAEKTGVSLEQLEEANPDLDPQLLAPGQRIRLPQ